MVLGYMEELGNGDCVYECVSGVLRGPDLWPGVNWKLFVVKGAS